MKVLYVGWGWRPKQMGGSVLYAKFLVEELARQGHEVSYLYNGTHALRGRPYLRTHREGPVLVQELVNSPLRYYPAANHPAREAAEPQLDRLVGEAIRASGAEVVHIGEFTGWPASIVSVAHAAGARVVVTLMGYVAICPQHFLWRPDTSACEGPDGGRRCATCMTWLTEPQRRFLAFEQYLDTFASRPVRVGLRPLRRWLRSRVPPGDLLTSSPTLAAEYAEGLGERWKAYRAALEAADELIAISQATKRRYVSGLGLAAERLRVIRLKSPVDNIPRVAGWPETLHQPLTFGFLGSFLPHKGVQVVMEAFRRLDRQGAILEVWAPGRPAPDISDESLRAAGIHLMGPYEHHQLAEILPRFDVGLVSSLWEECGPLVADEMISAGLPLVTSDRGGASELVQPEVNGLVYPAVDPAALAACLQRFIDRPQLIVDYRRHLPMLPSMADQARAITEVYAAALAQPLGQRNRI